MWPEPHLNYKQGDKCWLSAKSRQRPGANVTKREFDEIPGPSQSYTEKSRAMGGNLKDHELILK